MTVERGPRRDRISLRQLVVGYGRAAVAGPVDAAFEPGKLCALTGPNGCGKTTLLRTILGFLTPISGSVEGLAGQTCSYVPQLGNLDAGFPVTVREVVATGIRDRVDRRVRQQRVGDALRQVGMDETRRQRFFRLSGGQRQRVLLARALCANADFVALDEPTAGVDSDAAGDVWRALQQIAASGRAVLVVTHDLFRAPDYADQVWVLSESGLQEHSA